MTRGVFGLMVGLAIWGWAQAGRAQTAADPGWTQPEAWAWSQIQAGEVADFDARCLGAGPECRVMRGATIAQMLSQEPLQKATPHAGLRIAGAAVHGDIDLVNAHVAAAVSLVRSQVAGDVLLTRARLDGLFALDGSVVAGQVHGIGLQAETDISLTDGRWLVPDPKLDQGFHAQGPVNLQNAQIKGSVFLNAAQFDSDVDFSGAHIAGDVKTSGATFGHQLRGTSMQVAGKLSINATIVRDAVLCPNATVGGLVDSDSSQFGRLNMMGAKVAGDLDLSHLRTGGDVNLMALDLTGGLSLVDPNVAAASPADDADPCETDAGATPAFQGNLLLTGASVGGTTVLSGMTMTGAVNLDNARLKDVLDLRNACLRNGLSMASLHVAGNLQLRGAHLSGRSESGSLAAADLEVAHDLDLSHAVFETAVNLFGAQIGDTVHIEDSHFLDKMVAPGLRSTSDLKLHGADFHGLVDLSRTRLGGDLDLTAAHFITLDLNRADISGALVVDPATTWDAQAGQLNLTHTHLGALQDAGGVEEEDCPNAGQPRDHNGWPVAGMELDGLTYDHLGEAAGPAGVNMRARNVCWWRWWLERDATFSEQPYMQLAAVMAAHGDQGNASAIAYFGRLRETDIARDGGHYGRWLLLSLFNVTVGYGIGGYSSRALMWVAGLTVLGALMLKKAPGAQKHSALWRFGASMARVLPAIEINKEFSDFFNDPGRERLTGRQVAFFSALAVFGWALGLFIVAALSGLTQHS